MNVSGTYSAYDPFDDSCNAMAWTIQTEKVSEIEINNFIDMVKKAGRPINKALLDMKDVSPTWKKKLMEFPEITI